jgi:E3 ubiquitin-protein ligase RAD18
MLKEQALKKKMLELGISSQGPRILLEKRHKEWLTLWNANCDAAIPKKRSELLHDLEVWERTQGGRAPTTGRVIQTAAVIKDKDFDGAAWAAKHDSSFKDLIANARKGREEAKKKMEEADKLTNDQSQSSTSQPPELMIISSSQPPSSTIMDDPATQQMVERSGHAPDLQSQPPTHAEPMAWEASQRPIGSTPTTEASELRNIVEADKY